MEFVHRRGREGAFRIIGSTYRNERNKIFCFIPLRTHCLLSNRQCGLMGTGNAGKNHLGCPKRINPFVRCCGQPRDGPSIAKKNEIGAHEAIARRLNRKVHNYVYLNRYNHCPGRALRPRLAQSASEGK